MIMYLEEVPDEALEIAPNRIYIVPAQLKQAFLQLKEERDRLVIEIDELRQANMRLAADNRNAVCRPLGYDVGKDPG